MNIPHLLTSVRGKFPDARQEQDGSITLPECPLCRDEGHPHKSVKVFVGADGRITGVGCSRFAGAGAEANREHCAPLRELLGLGDGAASASIREVLLDGRLTLECSPAERGKARLVARNCTATLHRDTLSLDKAEERAKFIKALDGLGDDERKLLHQALLTLADRFESVRAAVKGDEGEEEAAESVIFKALPDGRLVEQIAGGQFAVYDGTAVKYARRVEYDGGLIVPVSGDPFVEPNDLHLPSGLAEYGDERLLDEEVEDYLGRFCDAPVREMKFAARLVRLTYIQDRLREVPYLHVMGPPGSGKTRLSEVVGMACRLPVLLVEGTAASTFRICDRYSPTLCFDEFNLDTDSEDKQALVQILNAGFQRRRKVPRTEKGPNGEQVTRTFSPFGVKIFSGLKMTGSFAFESRTIPIHLSVTRNKQIPYCDDGLIEELSEPLRQKLTLWRLRNWNRDYRSLLREAEAIFKTKDILPRFIQIGVPLAMLISEPGLRDAFIATMEVRTKDAKQATAETLDGQIVQAIHALLVEVDERTQAAQLRLANARPPEPGKPCTLATVGSLLAACEESLPERVRLQRERGQRIWLGKQVSGLGLRSEQINAREDANYGQKALIFDPELLEKLFVQFSLPVPPDFNAGNAGKSDNALYQQQDAPASIGPGKRAGSVTNTGGAIVANESISPDASIASIETGGSEEKDFSEANPSNVPTPSALVALDTETEPFDPARGVTPQNCRMIGLALCYDGERADYETDAEAWPLLMPEPEQTVLMHNAKFDLGVLRRTGLPLPERWEDNLIASHLLDECGAHGLKPLAKEHLGVDEPMTFAEADRMRLLNPEVFHEYARNDARYTFRLWPKFRREMERQGLTRVYELEKAVLPVVLAMEGRGMKLDLSQMSAMRAEVEAETAKIEAEVYEHAGCRFDLHSPQKVAAILFDKLGVPSEKITNGGQRSVDKQALEEVRGYHPAVDATLRFREIDKLASTFLAVLPKFADSEGRIHPEFKQLGAKTGRFSCSDPNVQQIPSRSELGKRLRQMFIADEGNVLVVADWSQMELRILAHYSRDPLLLEAYTAEQETDLHALTASRMFGKEVDSIEKSERTVAKMINFGIAYGITPAGLFNRLRPAGVDVTEEDCQRFVADYFKTYPGVRKFLARAEQAARERGYVRSLFGRRRRLKGGERGLSSREVRQAQNFIIQATAADLAKDAMVRLHAALPEGASLIATIHDEFIVECRREQAEEVRALTVETMQQTPAGFAVPVKVDAKIGENWGACK
jgi:DNA polymerase I-like protein with 3'-5' exonuclease and polymerase domains